MTEGLNEGKKERFFAYADLKIYGRKQRRKIFEKMKRGSHRRDESTPTIERLQTYGNSFQKHLVKKKKSKFELPRKSNWNGAN